MTESVPPPDPEVKSDEEWKAKVKAEDAQRDAQAAAQPAAATEADPRRSSSAADSAEARLPPATFSTLVTVLYTQSLVALGLVPDPASGKPQAQPQLARHFIDLLSVLETKTAGNLDAGEARLLDSALHELRMAYVEVSRQNQQ